jgi:hypothetical protein
MPSCAFAYATLTRWRSGYRRFHYGRSGIQKQVVAIHAIHLMFLVGSVSEARPVR